MAYNTEKHGIADQRKWAQLSTADVATLTAQEGPDLLLTDPAGKFAQLTYQINPSPINLSGEVVVDGVRIEGYDQVNEAQVDAAHNMFVIDSSVLGAIQSLTGSVLNSTDIYSRIIQVSGDYTYMMHALPPALSGNPAWRVQRIDADGSRMWADGDASFDNIASGYLDLTYTY